MMDEAEFMSQVEAVESRRPGLSMLHAGLLVALRAGIAGDTRSFARVFGVAHALVLRAASELSEDHALVEETGRGKRTQRARLALTAAGQSLFDRAPHPMAA